MKYGKLNLGEIEALVNKLGGMKIVDGILDGSLEFQVIKPEKRWREEDGILHLTLAPSDGTTGPEWINRLKDDGHKVSDYAQQVLNSDDFKPTKGVTYNLAIIKGEKFEDSHRITKNIRKMADNKGYIKPNAEVACLIREQFSNEELEEMGLIWIVAMHEPIKDSDGDPRLLRAGRNGGGWLDGCWGKPDARWYRGDSFAFVASQVST
ncbi:hypothetical protein COB64_04140 [Candidatus Wolfebacteria bacterium]|nr:MAG: hypothetical protein COB64_04140 [Candidatus Wolfebacteria bacterium]